MPLAQDGNSEAQCIIGSIYHMGLGSTERDEAEAKRWYTLASEQGYGLATNNLATLISISGGDRSRVRELYQLARTQSFIHAPIL
ncbi:MAG: sel1 repeat family protein [Cyanobacteriota bacterium]|nr:sel1 repeat family protein [Cyanobacteriota bacterium]